MKNKVIEEVKKIEYILQSLHKEAVQIVENNKQRKAILDGDTETIEGRYRRSLQDIDDTERAYNLAIAENQEIINKLQSMVDMLPEKYRNGYQPTVVNCPDIVNIEYVSELFENITTDTFSSAIKRKFHTGGHYDYKKMVKDFLQLVAEHQLYYDTENQSLLGNCISETTSRKKMAEDDCRANLNKHAQLESTFKADEVRETQELIKKRNEFFASDLVLGFSKRIEKDLVDSGALEKDWQTYSAKRNRNYTLDLGNLLVPCQTDSVSLKKSLVQAIPKFAIDGYFKIPYIVETSSPLKIRLNYNTEGKSQASDFVQNLLLNLLRSAPIDSFDVYFIDPVNRGTNLGCLNASIEENKKIGISTYNSKEEISNVLRKLEKEVDETNSLVGTFATLREFNKVNKKYIKEKIIVVFDFAENFSADDILRYKSIVNNAHRCGIHLIIATNKNKIQLIEKYRNNNIEWSFYDTGWVKIENNTINIDGEAFEFSTSSIGKHQKDFVNIYRKETEKGLIIDNSFGSVFGGEIASNYEDATKGLNLPIMIRKEKGNELFELPIGVDYKSVHTLITGRTGIGKSTLLHMIISSIVMKYHPDDVELWLVDYGIEFASSLKVTPPHVRFIAVEKSQEFTYSFLDYLKQKINEREELFKKSGVKDIKDYRRLNGQLSMPRIIIIVDEFHNMAQHASKEIYYRELLENVLREVRKYGISCIFSDQTISGLQGLTEAGKMQIMSRIAMNNHMNEMIGTLGVNKANFSEEVIHKMERSTSGEVWCLEWVNEDFKISNFKVVYIKSDEIDKVYLDSISKGIKLVNDKEIVRIGLSDELSFPISEVQAEIKHISDFSLSMILGKPTSISKFFKLNIEKRLNNNILIVGNNIELQKSLLANTILNLSILGNKKILVFADEYNQVFRVMREENLFRSKTCSISVFTDISQICVEINKIEKQISNRQINKEETFVIWLGLADIFSEFDISPKKDVEKLEQADDEFGMFISDADMLQLEKDEGFIREAKERGITVREAIEEMFDVRQATAASPKQTDFSYNAKEDALSILAKGCKYGVFNIVSFENAKEITTRRDLKLELFIHKFLFNMPREDFADFYIRADEVGLDETSVLYTNGVVKQKFRPYLIPRRN